MRSRTSSHPRGHGRKATTCSRSARSSRARTCSASHRRSTGSCASSARAAGAASTPPANVTWRENVTDEELAALYRGARCLVYASLYEGFGIPVAEALACGCPVVTSAGSPMAELAGDDAALVDPEDVESIRDGIARAQRPAARRGPSWAAGGGADAVRLRGARVIVVDADVLGRNRTGEETYVLNLLRQLPFVAPDLHVRRRHAAPRPRAGGRRADRAARTVPGGANGLGPAPAPTPSASRRGALPARAAARLERPERADAARPALRARSERDGLRGSHHVQDGRPALGAARDARARRLRADEARCDRALRPRPGDDHRHAARRRSRVHAGRRPRGRVPALRRGGAGAQGPAGRAGRGAGRRPAARRRRAREGAGARAGAA